MGDSTTQMSARSNLTETAMFVVWAIFGDFFGDIPDSALKIQWFNKFPGKNDTGNPLQGGAPIYKLVYKPQ